MWSDAACLAAILFSRILRDPTHHDHNTPADIPYLDNKVKEDIQVSKRLAKGESYDQHVIPVHVETTLTCVIFQTVFLK